MPQFIKQITKQGQIVDIYQIIKQIGTGGFAKVYKATCLRTSQNYAIKVISKLTVNQNKAFQKLRLQINRKIKHRNIVKLEKVFDDEENVYLVMELCQNYTLKELQLQRSRLTEFQVRYYVSQIVSALEYLHANRILHRDIKLGNIFINEKMELKIGDFGLSVRLKDKEEKRYTTCGTPNYIAPQILSEQGHSFEVDVWGVGIITYTLLIGKPPFEQDTVQNTYQAIQDMNYKFPLSIPISKEAKSFIQSIIKLKPQHRSSLQQIKNHPFLSKTCNRIPITLPTQLLQDPPSSRLLRQYDYSQKLQTCIVPRRLSNLNRQQSGKSEIQLKQKILKLKRSISFHRINSKNLKSYDNPTINNILSSRTKQSNNSSKTKQSISHRSKSKINRSKSQMINFKDIQQPEEEIVSYLDWSDKYGIGYILSSGTIGLVFNDKTSISKHINIFYYLDKQKIQHQYDQKSIPISIFKKFKIFKQLQSNLSEIKGPKIHKHKSKNSIVYIKRFLKKKNILILKSSNDLCYYIWKDCTIRLKNYKQLKWRIKDGRKGYGNLLDEYKEKVINQRVKELRDVLKELTTEKEQ